MSRGWAERPGQPARARVAPYAAVRRAALSAVYPGRRLVIPAGGLKIRSNDCDYVFRPHSAFAHLTGLGADREPDAVLMLDPNAGGTGHEATLFFRPRAERESEEFYLNPRYGEFWVGLRPSLADLEHELGLICRHLDELPDALAKDLGGVPLSVLRDADQTVTRLVDDVRESAGGADASDAVAADLDLARFCSELRLVKDRYEVQQLRHACAATVEGFELIVRELDQAVARGRGERWLEGAFGMVARHRGNGVGYSSIVAAGEHACTLHWIRNDGDVRAGDLVLIDAGVEVDSLYTADVTRTLPVSGHFTDVQRDIYDAVLAAQQAGFEAVRPGNKHADIHAATTQVIAAKLDQLGLLPVSVAESLDAQGQQHRRWMVHGTSHHLGLDVHDCAQARKECYADGELTPGMVVTVEPGLYFKADDEMVPEPLRGIGIRIEDDLLVTEDGYEVLSAGLPREASELEQWMASLRRS